jgi:hypothetical protein
VENVEHVYVIEAEKHQRERAFAKSRDVWKIILQWILEKQGARIRAGEYYIIRSFIICTN